MTHNIIDVITQLIDFNAVVAIILICYWLFEHSPVILRKWFGYPGAKTYATMVVAAIVSVVSYFIYPLQPVANVLAYFFATSFYELIIKQIKRQFQGPEV